MTTDFSKRARSCLTHLGTSSTIPSSMSQRIGLLVRLFLTVGLLALVFSRIDMAEFLGVVRSASIPLVSLAAVVQASTVLVAVCRWRIILENFGILIGYAPLARITFIGFFFNMFLPSGIGGDFFRAYYLARREEQSMSKTLTTTVLERSAGLGALLLIGLAASGIGSVAVAGVPVILVFTALSAAYLVANFALFHNSMHNWFMRLLERLKRWRLEERFEAISKGLETLKRNPRAMFSSLAISLLIQFLSVIVVWIASLSIQIDASLTVFLIFVPLINLTIMVPITINGIGLREGLYALLFQQVGVSAEAAVSLSLLQLLIFLLAGLPGGVIYSLYKKEERLEEIVSGPAVERDGLEGQTVEKSEGQEVGRSGGRQV